ncbi:TPA: RepB family plasmid replication initiator protein [Vibrio parahaemolyticus]
MASNKKRIVKQSNLLTTAAYSLSRNAKRTLYLSLNALADRDSLKFCEVEHGYIVDINHEEYSSIFSDKKNASRDIQRAAQEMREQAIRIYLPDQDGTDGEKALRERVWIVAYDHLPKQHRTKLYFNRSIVDMIPYKKGDPFTQYLLFSAGGLNNPYAMRLYESICQWRSSRTSVKFAVDWMLDRFAMPASYERMSDFRSKFLKVAVKEINDNTDIEITDCTELCEGARKNKVTHVVFTWSERRKVMEHKEPAAKELTKQDAISTYEDIMDKKRIPSLREIEHLKANLVELGSEGVDFGAGFFSKLRESEEAAQEIEGKA